MLSLYCEEQMPEDSELRRVEVKRNPASLQSISICVILNNKLDLKFKSEEWYAFNVIGKQVKIKLRRYLEDWERCASYRLTPLYRYDLIFAADIYRLNYLRNIEIVLPNEESDHYIVWVRGTNPIDERRIASIASVRRRLQF